MRFNENYVKTHLFKIGKRSSDFCGRKKKSKSFLKKEKEESKTHAMATFFTRYNTDTRDNLKFWQKSVKKSKTKKNKIKYLQYL